MISIKNDQEIALMRQGGKILALILNKAASCVEEGVRTKKIDDLVNELCSKYKVKPAFKGFGSGKFDPGYPNSICISINDEVVHGLPSERIIKNGDIVTLDFGVEYQGYITDSALTLAVGGISKEDEKLIEVTKKSLFLGLKEIREGARVGDISNAIQKCLKQNNLNYFDSLAGHGVGKKLHEDPMIPNFGIKNTGEILRKGMTLAVETMVTGGRGEFVTASDGWTLKTKDGQNAAQFEHTVVVTEKGYKILTD